MFDYDNCAKIVTKFVDRLSSMIVRPGIGSFISHLSKTDQIVIISLLCGMIYDHDFDFWNVHDLIFIKDS